MRKTIITTCAAAIVCGSAMAKGGNPFLGKYTTPFGIPPFEQIKVEHYKPAFIKGMEEHKRRLTPSSITRKRLPSRTPSLPSTAAVNYSTRWHRCSTDKTVHAQATRCRP